MSIKLGVSFYSYQQSQFFKELSLEDQIRELSENLPGADGVEIIDEMSLHYPDPGDAFVEQWHGWMDQYRTVPVTMDVGMDVLQFRDHVMTHEECAERLRSDIRLAHRLGFKNVRVLSTTPLDVMIRALPVAEELDIRLGREVHQPMPLEGAQVTEIVDFVEKTGRHHLGIVPDFGIFQFRPSEVMLEWFMRRGASPEACDAAVDLALALRDGNGPFGSIDMASQTAGNIRSDLNAFLKTGECKSELRAAFEGTRTFAAERVKNPTLLDYVVVAEALVISGTSPDTLRQLTKHVVSVHGKFNNMSLVEGTTDQYHELSIDYENAMNALKDGGYDGYVNSEYEGQRYFQDQGREDLQDEVEQVRRHQEMLRRLVA
ncbi:sugar phosphate isomerase/epimerase [Rhizobium sp. X9]|uniref:sugar phosphate isomerase/epimerase family protein n=1 Tax=Rhizobium sp. X9 TaxID=2815360 RepID=UPI001C0C4A87|nr:sugar phosphate isomerase/epimerase [Rhizobium sp. X9]